MQGRVLRNGGGGRQLEEEIRRRILSQWSSIGGQVGTDNRILFLIIRCCREASIAQMVLPIGGWLEWDPERSFEHCRVRWRLIKRGGPRLMGG